MHHCTKQSFLFFFFFLKKCLKSKQTPENSSFFLLPYTLLHIYVAHGRRHSSCLSRIVFSLHRLTTARQFLRASVKRQILHSNKRKTEPLKVHHFQNLKYILHFCVLNTNLLSTVDFRNTFTQIQFQFYMHRYSLPRTTFYEKTYVLSI